MFEIFNIFFIGSFDSIEFQRLGSSANVAEWRVFS